MDLQVAPSNPTSLQMVMNNMMRIAIAGSGGLARIFAQYINETVHPFIILSRNVSLPQDYFLSLQPLLSSKLLFFQETLLADLLLPGWHCLKMVT